VPPRADPFRPRKERQAAYRAEREARDPGYTERTNAKTRAKYDPDKHRAQALKAKFNLTPEQWDAIQVAQGRRCAICLKRFSKDRRRVANVDHSHSSGLVRGAVCMHCNFHLLGTFHDDADLFQRAADYLRNPPAVAVVGEIITPDFVERYR
jgi:Recombination endonuclease VII